MALTNKIKEKITIQLKETGLDKEERISLLDVTDFS